MQKLLGRVRPSQIDLEEFGNLSDLETDSFGSDSSVSDGLPMQLLHASIPEVICVMFCREQCISQ